jgi:transketolase
MLSGLRQLLAGTQLVMLTYGGIAEEVLNAAKKLQGEGISCAVYSMPSLSPFDRKSLLSLVKDYEVVVTVEEHVATGGLGSLLADVFMDSNVLPSRFARISLPNRFSSIVGSQEYLRACNGLDSGSIATKVRKLLEVEAK